MIDLAHISFTYRSTDAAGQLHQVSGVKDINLHIAPGEFVVLAGNSGCGKTTITRLINGLVPHYYEGELEGEVRVCGLDVRTTKISVLSAHVGSVFQNPRSQFFNVDTTSEMAFVSENQCVPPEQIRRDIHDVVQRMNMEPLMDRSIFALSGGEKQKVACASVAVVKPEVVVLDEPSSNLDAAGIEDVRKVLEQWKADGKTVVVAEHRLFYLVGLADRILVMHDGRIVEQLDATALKTLRNEDAYARGLRAFYDVGMGRVKGALSRKRDTLSREQDAPTSRSASSGDKLSRPHNPHGAEGSESGSAAEQDRTLVCRNFDFCYKHSSNGIRFDELRFRAGEITAIVGRNGAGKSTFAHLLCGLERKDEGSVTFEGRTYTPRQRSKLCYMILQDVNHQLFAESVLEEVLLSAPAGMSREEGEKHARAVLDQLDLSALAETHPMALSGGQKQRVAIASGVMADAPVLLFDEPTSGLDLGHMRQVADLLRTLRDDGRVVIVVTHDIELVAKVADCVIKFPPSTSSAASWQQRGRE